MTRIRVMNGPGAVNPDCWIDIGCNVCGINWCDICICDHDEGCPTYVPPCTDCSPVE